MKRNGSETEAQNCHHFRFEAKWSETEVKVFFSLVFASEAKRKWNEAKQKEKEVKRIETKKIWKRNKAKIRSSNFALIGSEKLSVRNFFASFRFEAKNFFLRNRRTLIGTLHQMFVFYIHVSFTLLHFCHGLYLNFPTVHVKLWCF